MRQRRILIIGVVIILSVLLSTTYLSYLNKGKIKKIAIQLLRGSNNSTEQPSPHRARQLLPLRAKVRISLFDEDIKSDQVLIHTTSFVNDSHYIGMTDNDLRGLLDGNYKYRWNQASQIHLRIGRRPNSGRHGQYELFRVLQKWKDISLPKGTKVISSSLRITVEERLNSPVTLMLYSVNKKWISGEGGVKRNNNSQPKEGEVWWGELSADNKGWGLPGAGYSSDEHPDADRSLMPLAIKIYRPGDNYTEFSSPQLAEYVQRQSADGEPLLFLLKLADYDEDIKGSILAIYSGDEGDSLNQNDRRPLLTINWQNDRVTHMLEKEIQLEYGRYFYFPKIDVRKKQNITADIFNADESDSAVVEIRGGSHGQISNWEVLNQPKQLDNWDWVQARVSQLKNNVVLGSKFENSFRNTWVTTAVPEQQEVTWSFISPEGYLEKIKSSYQGDYTWKVEYLPNIIGRWQYYMTNNFIKEPYTSEVGVFDVIPGDKDNIIKQLGQLLVEINNPYLNKDLKVSEKTNLYFQRFSRLERAILYTQTPESFRSEEGQEVRGILNKIRLALDPNHPLPKVYLN